MPCLGGQGQKEDDDDDSPEGFTITPWDGAEASMDVSWVSFEEPEECVDLDHVRPHGDDDDDGGTSGIRKAHI